MSSSTNPTGSTFTFEGLSKWGTVCLSLSDNGFIKLHSKESHYEKDKDKYDLSSENFRAYTRHLIEKVECILAGSDFKINIRAGKDTYMLKEYTSISIGAMNKNRDAHWPNTAPTAITNQKEANQFTDSQIKTLVIGNYIHESLTDAAKEQLLADEDLFKVTDLKGENYYDGPSYFHCIAQLVDPDNGHMVAKAKTEICNLDVKIMDITSRKCWRNSKT